MVTRVYPAEWMVSSAERSVGLLGSDIPWNVVLLVNEGAAFTKITF